MIPRTSRRDGVKFKDSSLTFFELNKKDTVVYDLKKWFKQKKKVSRSQHSPLNWNELKDICQTRLLMSNKTGDRSFDNQKIKTESIELFFLDSSTKQLSPFVVTKEENDVRKEYYKEGLSPRNTAFANLSSLPAIDWSQWLINTSPSKPVGRMVPSIIQRVKNQKNTYQKYESSQFYSPDQNRQFLNWTNSWNLLSHQLKKNRYVTGRISRSLKRAGLCVWLGGVTAFLPYREYSLRHQVMPSFEGQLKTFQIVSLNPSNLNCVVTRDKAIQSIVYRASQFPDGGKESKARIYNTYGTQGQVTGSSNSKSGEKWGSQEHKPRKFSLPIHTRKDGGKKIFSGQESEGANSKLQKPKNLIFQAKDKS